MRESLPITPDADTDSVADALGPSTVANRCTLDASAVAAAGALDASAGAAAGALDAASIAALVEEHVTKLASTLRPDYLAALEASVTTEESERGREVLEQLLANARIAATEGLPLCQDTGYVWVCLEVSGPVCVPGDVFSDVDAAVARAAVASGMRMSMLRDALVDRTNTANNTPAFCEVLVKSSEFTGETAALPAGDALTGGVPVDNMPLGDAPVDNDEVPVGDAPLGCAPVGAGNADKAPLADTFDSATAKTPAATLHIMLKGGGSDNASALAMLPPGVGIKGVLDFVVNTVVAKGANACPPLVLGVGVGGSFDKVASLAKRALLRQVGSMHPNSELAALEGQLLSRINALGIGPGGLGGSTTALAVHIESAPCHIAALPVAVNVGCTALRSVSIPLI